MVVAVIVLCVKLAALANAKEVVEETVMEVAPDAEEFVVIVVQADVMEVALDVAVLAVPIVVEAVLADVLDAVLVVGMTVLLVLAIVREAAIMDVPLQLM